MYSCEVDDSVTEDRETLIIEHLPQVRLIARRIHERLPGHVSLDDLISNGTIGLISAIDNFDPNQKVKLKTYAEYRIRGAILDGLRGMDWAPRGRRKLGRQIENAIASSEQSPSNLAFQWRSIGNGWLTRRIFRLGIWNSPRRKATATTS
jgi:RNA polymerase sigma factor for flagellar operon FliA